MGCNEPCSYADSCSTGFSVGNLIGNIYNSDGDVISAGGAVEGYYAITTHPLEELLKLLMISLTQQIEAGKGDLDDKSRIGSVVGTRRSAGVFHTEALRIAQERFGPKVNSAQVRWGFENLRLDKARLDELGATGLVPEINIAYGPRYGHLANPAVEC